MVNKVNQQQISLYRCCVCGPWQKETSNVVMSEDDVTKGSNADSRDLHLHRSMVRVLHFDYWSPERTFSNNVQLKVVQSFGAELKTQSSNESIER